MLALPCLVRNVRPVLKKPAPIKVNVLMVLKRKEGDKLPLSTGLCQSCFRFFDQSGERYFVEYGDVSQDLTVDFNRGFFQAIDEFAVRNTVRRAAALIRAIHS